MAFHSLATSTPHNNASGLFSVGVTGSIGGAPATPTPTDDKKTTPEQQRKGEGRSSSTSTSPHTAVSSSRSNLRRLMKKRSGRGLSSTPTKVSDNLVSSTSSPAPRAVIQSQVAILEDQERQLNELTSAMERQQDRRQTQLEHLKARLATSKAQSEALEAVAEETALRVGAQERKHNDFKRAASQQRVRLAYNFCLPKKDDTVAEENTDGKPKIENRKATKGEEEKDRCLPIDPREVLSEEALNLDYVALGNRVLKEHLAKREVLIQTKREAIEAERERAANRWLIDDLGDYVREYTAKRNQVGEKQEGREESMKVRKRNQADGGRSTSEEGFVERIISDDVQEQQGTLLLLREAAETRGYQLQQQQQQLQRLREGKGGREPLPPDPPPRVTNQWRKMDEGQQQANETATTRADVAAMEKLKARYNSSARTSLSSTTRNSKR